MNIGFLKGSIAFDKYKTVLKNKPQLPLNLPHKYTMACTEGTEAQKEPTVLQNSPLMADGL